MPVTDGQLMVQVAQDPQGQRDAAGIWARATAKRDHLSPVASIEEKLAGIQQTLAGDGASLHLARRGQHVVGFCILVPQAESLEIRYLATAPDVWGSGAGRALLEHVQTYARQTAIPRGELWVIADNERAIRAYEHAGWVSTPAAEVRGSSGRLERRFVRDFG